MCIYTVYILNCELSAEDEGVNEFHTGKVDSKGLMN